MRVIFAGTPEAALPSLDAIAGSDHEVVAVLTRPDAPKGRGRRLDASPVAAAARARGLLTLTPATLREPGIQQQLAELTPEAIAVVAYGALVPPELLDLPRHGWVNLHFSLLPAWRGAAPVQHAIMAGDEITGASTFRIEEGLDTGPVFGTLTETIGPHDTAGDLLQRLAGDGAGLLLATLDGLQAGTLEAVPQPGDGISRAPRLRSSDAQIRWDLPAMAVDRRIRGTTPAPGAWTTFAGRRLRLGPLTFAPGADDFSLAPGEILVLGQRVLVGTGTDPVELGEVTPAGKGAMPAIAWARGARPATGARFEVLP